MTPVTALTKEYKRNTVGGMKLEAFQVNPAKPYGRRRPERGSSAWTPGQVLLLLATFASVGVCLGFLAVMADSMSHTDMQ
jgi:hypothetical protein